MPEVSMELIGFSFKRADPDWIGPIEVSIRAPDSCVVLTGINAGGKSLTLRALEKFTALLTDPNKPNKDEFEALAKVARIGEISATYSFEFPTEDLYSVEIGDEERLLSASGAPPGAEIIDEELRWRIENRIETRWQYSHGFPSGIYTRRFGVYLRVRDILYVIDEDIEHFALTDLMFLEWDGVFDDPANLAKDKMFLYGPDGFEGMIRERTGIAVESEIYDFENHEFWDKKSAYQFVAKRVIMLQVDEAYRVSARTINMLHPFNEGAKATKKGKTWMNKRLKTAFDKCYRNFEGQWADEWFREGFSLNKQREKLKKRLEKGEVELAEFNKQFEELQARRKSMGDLEEYIEGHSQLKFAEFLYPGRKTEYYVDEEGVTGFAVNDDGDLELTGSEPTEFKWVSKPNIPTVEMIIPPAEMKAATPDFTDDMRGICERLMAYCPKLLLEHDPDMFFWIIVSSFIDFPSVPSPSYYSSGQRRLISMIEAIMNSELGTVFLVDEPELSLHLDWQRRFIDRISVFGKGLILATHSPDIIYNHTEKVVEVPPRSEV